MFRIAGYIAEFGIVAVALAVAAGSGNAVAQQTKLKWAHVYETSEPYHKWSVWAAGEIEGCRAGPRIGAEGENGARSYFAEDLIGGHGAAVGAALAPASPVERHRGLHP